MAKRNIKNKALWKKRISQALKGKKKNLNKNNLSDSQKATLSKLAAVGALAGFGYGLTKPKFRNLAAKTVGKGAQAIGASKGFAGYYYRKGVSQGEIAAKVTDPDTLVNKVYNATEAGKVRDEKAKEVGKSFISNLKEGIKSRIKEDSEKRKKFLGFNQTEDVQNLRSNLYSYLEFRKSLSPSHKAKISRALKGKKRRSKFSEIQEEEKVVSPNNKNIIVKTKQYLESPEYERLSKNIKRSLSITGTALGLVGTGLTIYDKYSSSGRKNRERIQNLNERIADTKRKTSKAYAKLVKQTKRKMDLEERKITLREMEAGLRDRTGQSKYNKKRSSDNDFPSFSSVKTSLPFEESKNLEFRKPLSSTHKKKISIALKNKKRNRRIIAGVGVTAALSGLGYLGYKKLSKNYGSVSPRNIKGRVVKPKVNQPPSNDRVNTDMTVNVKGITIEEVKTPDQIPATTYPKTSKGKFKKKGKVVNGVMTNAESGFSPRTVEGVVGPDGKGFSIGRYPWPIPKIPLPNLRRKE